MIFTDCIKSLFVVCSFNFLIIFQHRDILVVVTFVLIMLRIICYVWQMRFSVRCISPSAKKKYMQI